MSSTEEAVLAIRLHKLDEDYPLVVQATAGRWVDGLKALLGLTGIIGIFGGPFAAGKLEDSVQVTIGWLLAAVLAGSALALFCVMSAAFGATSMKRTPGSLASLASTLQGQADRNRHLLNFGRACTAVVLIMLSAAIAIVWTNAPKPPEVTVITKDKLSYCGSVLVSKEGTLALKTEQQSRVELAMSDITGISSKACPEG
jgi:hypothetical protein